MKPETADPRIPFLAYFGIVAPDTVTSDAAINNFIFSHRLQVEMLLAALCRAFNPNDANHDASKEKIRLVIECLDKTNNGQYTQDQLNQVRAQLFPFGISAEVSRETTPRHSQERLANPIEEATENNTLVIHVPPAFKKKKYKKIELTAIIQTRSLAARLFDAVIDVLSALPGESLRKIDSRTYVAQEVMKELSWILAAIRLIATVSAAVFYARGYENSELEKEIDWQLRFLYQIKRKKTQVMRDVLWTILGGVRCLSEFADYSPEFRQGLFDSMFFLSILYEWQNHRAFQDFLKQKTDDSDAALAQAVDALTTFKQDVSRQNKVNIFIWFFYVLGSAVAIIGKESSKLHEKIELLVGSCIIMLTCIAQLIWEWQKRNLFQLDFKNDSSVAPKQQIATSAFFRSRTNSSEVIKSPKPEEKQPEPVTIIVKEERKSPCPVNIIVEAERTSPINNPITDEPTTPKQQILSATSSCNITPESKQSSLFLSPSTASSAAETTAPEFRLSN